MISIHHPPMFQKYLKSMILKVVFLQTLNITTSKENYVFEQYLKLFVESALNKTILNKQHMHTTPASYKKIKHPLTTIIRNSTAIATHRTVVKRAKFLINDS